MLCVSAVVRLGARRGESQNADEKKKTRCLGFRLTVVVAVLVGGGEHLHRQPLPSSAHGSAFSLVALVAVAESGHRK